MTRGILLFIFITIFGNFPIPIVLGIYHLIRRARRPEATARILHWSDALSVCAPFWVWVVLASWTHIGPVKSMSNIVEPAFCGWFLSALLGLRAGIALWKKRLRVDYWGYATLAATLLGIVLIFLLVPGLPE